MCNKSIILTTFLIILTYAVITVCCCNGDKVTFDRFENIEYKYIGGEASGPGGILYFHVVYVKNLDKMEEEYIKKFSLGIYKNIEKDVLRRYPAAKHR